MKIAVVIETVERPVQNYLDTTLANFRRAGGFESPYLHSLQISDGATCTRQQNAARAIRMGAATDADWVVKLEDDLDFTDQFMENLAGWLEDYGHTTAPMIALGNGLGRVCDAMFAEGERCIFDPGVSFPSCRQRLARNERIAPLSVLGFWGAQALMWKRPVAQALADWLGDDPFFFDGKREHRNRGHDLQLQVWGRQTGARCFAAIIPSLVQHIGRRSSLDVPHLNHVQKFFEFPFAGYDYRYQKRTQTAGVKETVHA
jgi:hypothetical protein